MKHFAKRIILLLVVMVIGGIVLLSYFYSGSRAGRLVSNKEYLESLRDASRGRNLVGNNDFIPTDQSSTLDSEESIQNQNPQNLFELLLFQLKALFKLP